MGLLVCLWLLILTILGVTHSTPFLYNVPEALTTLVSSASAASSGSSSLPVENIADLRQSTSAPQKAPQTVGKKNDDDESTFFKVPLEQDYQENSNMEESNNEASPGIIQKKIGKILRKIQFISMLSSGNGFLGGSGTDTATSNDDDFQKDQDDFDKEFEEDFGTSSGNGTDVGTEVNNNNKTAEPVTEKSKIVEGKQGRSYKPRGLSKVTGNGKRSAKLEGLGDGGLTLSPGGIGVFFMELFGSVIGLVYGAAAQYNEATAPTMTVSG